MKKFLLLLNCFIFSAYAPPLNPFNNKIFKAGTAADKIPEQKMAWVIIYNPENGTAILQKPKRINSFLSKHIAETRILLPQGIVDSKFGEQLMTRDLIILGASSLSDAYCASSYVTMVRCGEIEHK